MALSADLFSTISLRDNNATFKIQNAIRIDAKMETR